jgi:AAA domain
VVQVVRQTNKSVQSNKPPDVVSTVPVPTHSLVTDEFRQCLKFCIYGKPKTGKTRLARSFPKPLLLMGTEDGTKSISTGRKELGKLPSGLVVWELFSKGQPNGVLFIRMSRAEHFDECLDCAVRQGCKAVVLDTGGGMLDLTFISVLGLEEVPVQKTFGMADQATWGLVTTQFKQRLALAFALADRGVLDFVVIAHEREFKVTGRGTDTLAPAVGAALTPQCSDWLNASCDYIGQTFIRPQVITAGQEFNGVVQEVDVRTGKVEFCLRIGPHEIFMTGFRHADEVELPDVVVNPTYEKVNALIQGES